MIVEFRFKNYRSFADESFVQFDAVPAFKENPDNLIQTKDVSLLKSLAIYGANASGKTNVIVALRWLRNQVLRSAKQNSTDRIVVHPFALDKNLAGAPTLMEIRLLIDGVYYRYGFEAMSESIVSEWLMWSKRINGRDWALFTRDSAGISYGNSYKGEKLCEKDILKNTLLLSRLDQANVEVAAKLMRWFKNLRIVFGANGGRRYNTASIDMLDADESREAVVAFMQLADSTIEDIVHHDVEDLPADFAEFLKKKKGCDMVIVLSHCGMESRYVNDMGDMNFVSQLSNVDIIIGGHTHTDLLAPIYVEGADGKPVMIVTDYCNGIYVGQITCYR